MPIEMLRCTTNVIRFPVERRVKPSLELMRDLAPDPREILNVLDGFQIECDPFAARPGADLITAEYLRDLLPATAESDRDAILDRLLEAPVKRAIASCQEAEAAMNDAGQAEEHLLRAQTEGGYWLEPIERRATFLTNRAAELLVDAYVAAEEAEGAARAIGIARSGKAWHPFDVHAEAEALFFGT